MSSAHWGTFEKDLAWNYGYQAASHALARNGYQEWGRWDFPGVSGAVIGANGQGVVVQVNYAAMDGYARIAYSVTGVSGDSHAAETGRNTVRESIVAWHTID